MPYSPLIALILGFVLTPIMGLITKGKYYIKATDDGVKESRYDATGLPIATVYHCVSCDEDYEIPILAIVTNIIYIKLYKLLCI